MYTTLLTGHWSNVTNYCLFGATLQVLYAYKHYMLRVAQLLTNTGCLIWTVGPGKLLNAI